MQGLLCFYGWNEEDTQSRIHMLQEMTGISLWKTLDYRPHIGADYVLDLRDTDISSKIGETFNAIAYFSGWPKAIPDGIRNLDRCLSDGGWLIITQQMCIPLLNMSGVPANIPPEYQSNFNTALVNWIAPHYKYLMSVPDVPRKNISQDVFMKIGSDFVYVCPG